MSGSTRRIRTIPRVTWLTPEEDARLDKMVADSGANRADLMRSALFRYRLPSKADRQFQATLLAEIGKIGGNVNQYAHRLNILQSPPDALLMDAIHATLRELLEWRGAIMQALGLERNRKRGKVEIVPKDHQ